MKHRPAFVAGGVLVLAALAWTGVATLWTVRSERAGASLVRGALLSQGHGAGCIGSDQQAGQPAGLLEVPALGLTAPVVQGDSPAQLDQAVGHDPASVWPGHDGTAVLAAHDVSYFVHLDQLKVGDIVRYQTGCRVEVFKVAWHRVVKAGTPEYNSAAPTLLMGTCWPTNALWFTPDRYLVQAVRVGGTTQAAPTSPAHATQSLVVAAPAPLAAQGLTLAQNSFPMGAFRVAGSPSPAWVQSPSPLGTEEAALRELFGILRAAEQRQPSWWQALAPGVPLPPALLGAQVDPTGRLDVTVSAEGGSVTGVGLTDEVRVIRDGSVHSYRLQVSEAVRGPALQVAAVTMSTPPS